MCPKTRKYFVLASLLLTLAPVGSAQEGPMPFVINQFDPDIGTLVSVGFDSATDRVWLYNSVGDFLMSYSATGTFLSSIDRPGEAGNDDDIDFASGAFTLGATLVPEDSLLFVDGESGTADIYAVDPATGIVIASLTTDFGVDHVVGGAYHRTRDTFFLVEDWFNLGAPSTVAEINPATGVVINSFRTDAFLDYDVNFGDLDIDASTGNLLVVSSAESTILELTPTGSFVRVLPLPGGVTSLSGIAVVDDKIGEVYVSGTGGDIWHLGGMAGDSIFSDGFESGDTSAWTAQQPPP